MVALSAADDDAFEPDLLDLRQPPVRSALRDGAARQPPRGDAGNRVVSPELAGAYAYCERLARDRTTRTFRSRRACCRRAMRPHVAAIYAFARLADDMADEGDRPAADRLADLDAWDALPRRRRPRRRARAASRTPRSSWRSRHTIDACRLPVQLLHDLLSAFRRTSPSSATRPGTTCWTTAAARPIRSAGWSCAIAGYDRRRARRRVRRRLHGAAADELLAGPRRSTGRRAASTCRRRSGSAAGAREADLDAGRMTPAWRAALRRRRRAHPRAVRRRPAGLRRRRAAGCAGSCARPGSAGRGFSISWRPRISTSSTRRPDARRAAGRARRSLWRTLAWTRAEADWPETPASTTRSSCCRPTSGAPSSPCGISAARWTMPSTRREGGDAAARGRALARGAGAVLRRRRAARRRRDARCSR